MERLCADSAPVGDSWSAAALLLCSLLQTGSLRKLHSHAPCRPVISVIKNRVAFHLPAFILISLSLHFGQDIIQGPYLRGDGVDLDPDSIRVHPGHSWAGQTLCTRAKLAGVVVGPDGAWKEPWRRVGGAGRACTDVGDRFRSRRVHTGRRLADGDGWVTSICLG